MQPPLPPPPSSPVQPHTFDPEQQQPIPSSSPLVSSSPTLPSSSTSSNTARPLSVSLFGVKVDLLAFAAEGRTLRRSLAFVAAVAAASWFLGPTQHGLAYLNLVFVICLLGLTFSSYLCGWVLKHDDGTPEMRAVSDPIRLGAEGFLTVQYGAIANISVVVALIIFTAYAIRATPQEGATGVAKLGNTLLGGISAITFLIGAMSSAASGWVSMWLASQANVRVTSAARRAYSEALLVCFRGGAFSAMISLTMCILGITIVYSGVYALLVPTIEPSEIPLVLVGFGFGASFVALFMQLGGGIYTKAADVGADMVGKVEIGIPEDDPRNPAVIADLVGDMVGDCVGSSADLFESLAAETLGTMLLGGTLAREAGVESPERFILFPLLVHAFDIIISMVGIMCVRAGRRDDDDSADPSPMSAMRKGYVVSLSLAFVEFTCMTYWCLSSEKSPSAWMYYAACGFVGMLTSFVFVASTNYYTDYEYWPVRSIAAASVTGHGTNIITGISVGLKSTAIPTVVVSIALIMMYHLGRASGLGHGRNAGLMGTAVGTMGMLSSAGFVLACNNYGPIADNAGGISEMSRQADRVRHRTDRLDAAGNVTKAITKGYSIGSAALACVLLFGAFFDEFSEYSGTKFESIDIAVPEVLVGGLLGITMIFYITGLSIAAVARTAMEVVKEVRRQLTEHPEIMEWKVSPDYNTCVQIVTKAALKEMIAPGLLAVVAPTTVGVIFRIVGDMSDRPMLGAEVLGSFITFASLTGLLMALFLDTTGGAWDNAKKFIELGNYGGKGSEAHKAAVTGDTVGDPFKDTAGPSLHVVIKLLSTTSLILAPLFIGVQQQNN